MEPLLHTSHIVWNFKPLEGDYQSLNSYLKRLNDLFVQYYPTDKKINITMTEENDFPVLTGHLPSQVTSTVRFTNKEIPFASYVKSLESIIHGFIKNIEYQYFAHPLMTDPERRIEYEKVICYDETDYVKEDFKFAVGDFKKSEVEMKKLLDKLSLLEIDGKYNIVVVLNDNTRYDSYQNDMGSYLILDIRKEKNQYMNKVISTNSINIPDINHFEYHADLMDEILCQLFKEGNEKFYEIEAYQKIQEKINLNNDLQETLTENNLLSKPKL